MKLYQITSLLLIAQLTFTGCASSPGLAPIDNALLASLSVDAKVPVGEARAARDLASDSYAAAQSQARNQEYQVAVAEASLRTVRSQLDESKLAVGFAEKNGSQEDLALAQKKHNLALSEANYGRDLLAVRKREFEVASLKETLCLEELRFSLAMVELTKAEALQDVDSIAAQQIPIKDYRKQVAYHGEEVAIPRSRADTAEARMLEARGNLADEKRKLDDLKKQ